MSIHEYATSILSIVLGLGVAQLLGGVAWMARNPKHSILFYAFGTWCTSVLLTILGWWWAIWVFFRDIQALSFWSFLPTFFISTLLYLACRILVPPSGELSTRLDENFPRVVKPLCICVAGLFSIAAFLSPTSVLQLEGIVGIVLVFIALGGVMAKTPIQHICIAVSWLCVYLLQQAIQPDIV